MFLIKYKKKTYGTKLLFVSHRGIQPPELESALPKEHKKIEEIEIFFFPLFWSWQYFNFFKSVIFLQICTAKRGKPPEL